MRDHVWNDEELEYSWQVDGRGWHMYEDGPTITIDDPALVLFGWHRSIVASGDIISRLFDF